MDRLIYQLALLVVTILFLGRAAGYLFSERIHQDVLNRPVKNAIYLLIRIINGIANMEILVTHLRNEVLFRQVST